MTDHAIAVMVTHSEVCPNQILELIGGDVSAVVDHIADLQEKVLRLEAELARRDAAASEPAFYIAASDVDNLKRSHVVEAAISKVIRFDEIPAYTAPPPADSGEPVYQLWSPGIDVWVECNKQRYDEWAHMPAQRRTLYTAAPPAVLPPKYADELKDRAELIQAYSKTQCEIAQDLGCDSDNESIIKAIYELKALGAQPQKVVELPERETEQVVGWGAWDAFDADATIAALDAANVKYEVKP